VPGGDRVLSRSPELERPGNCHIRGKRDFRLRITVWYGVCAPPRPPFPKPCHSRGLNGRKFVKAPLNAPELRQSASRTWRRSPAPGRPGSCCPLFFNQSKTIKSPKLFKWGQAVRTLAEGPNENNSRPLPGSCICVLRRQAHAAPRATPPREGKPGPKDGRVDSVRVRTWVREDARHGARENPSTYVIDLGPADGRQHYRSRIPGLAVQARVAARPPTRRRIQPERVALSLRCPRAGCGVPHRAHFVLRAICFEPTFRSDPSWILFFCLPRQPRKAPPA